MASTVDHQCFVLPKLYELIPHALRRPTMILYGINNIRDLFGHKVSLSMVKRNPVCRLGL